MCAVPFDDAGFIPRGVAMQGILVGGRDQFEDIMKASG
jgi:hypothetical protein